MDTSAKLNLIRQVGEEIVTEEDLIEVLKTKKQPIAYDGFEPSGTDIHIAQGIMRAINVNKMTKAGVKFKMLVADWHGWANNKMGGDLEKIQKVGRFYVEVWKHCGMDLKNVEFVWASDLLDNRDYWKTVMQVADIFHLGADICQLGMDQRKVNVLARELGQSIGFWKPVIVSHHMLMGLSQPVNTEGKDALERTIDLKMSTSRPDTAIFMTDSQ